MKNPLQFLFRSRDKPQDAVSGAPTFYFGTSASGKAVNPRNAVQVSTVYACVVVIAETIASLPFGVYEEQENGNRRATDHPLYRLLHDEPNPEMTSFVMRETMLTHPLLWGNSYSQIIRSGRNKIIGLYPLLPDKMEVDRDKNGVLTYTYTTTEGATVVLSPQDALQSKEHSRSGGACPTRCRVEVLGTCGSWTKVKFGSCTGYMITVAATAYLTSRWYRARFIA